MAVAAVTVILVMVAGARRRLMDVRPAVAMRVGQPAAVPVAIAFDQFIGKGVPCHRFGNHDGMAVLAAKLLLAPLCVVAVSLAGRRWGVAVAGVLGGLPVVAGPILLVFTLVHGRSFGADAAAGTLLGLAALTIFVVVYGRVAPVARPAPTVIAGWTAFLVGVALLTLIHPPPGGALLLVCAGFALGIRLLPAPGSAVGTAGEMPWWDLPARAGAALALVLALTALSGALGPHLSGLLAPFPIITSVLAVFTHAHGGADQVRVLLRNFLVGFYGFAAFCFTLAVALGSIGTAAAFSIALVAALAVQLTGAVIRSRVSGCRARSRGGDAPSSSSRTSPCRAPGPS